MYNIIMNNITYNVMYNNVMCDNNYIYNKVLLFRFIIDDINVTSSEAMILAVMINITVQRALPWPPNKLSHLSIMCKYVNSTTHAMVFNLQLCELCKFTHPY